MVKRLSPKTLSLSDLWFEVGGVRRLLEHTRACPAHLPMMEGDGRRPVAGVVLVVETSVYLASNGKDPAPLADDDRVVFADGLSPDDCASEAELVQRKVEMVGNADAAVFLDADAVELMLGGAHDLDRLQITVQHNDSSVKKVLMIPTGRETPRAAYVRALAAT